MADRNLKGYVTATEAARLQASVERIDALQPDPSGVTLHVLDRNLPELGFTIEGPLPADYEAWVVEDGRRVARLVFAELLPA